MQPIRQFIDTSFKPFTMYKGVSLGIVSVLAYAILMSLIGKQEISAVGIALMTVVLAAVAFVANHFLAKLYKAPYGTESWLITALILACIIFPTASPSRLALAALAALIAIASKYVITWRGGQIFNPAAMGAFVLSATGLLPATWWVASPIILPATLILGVVTLYRFRLFSLFFAFAAAATAVMLYVVCVLQGQPVDETLRLLVASYPLIFLGTIMLTEPSTLPSSTFNRVLYALLVGALFSSQLKLGPIAMSPLLALLIGNVFSAFVSPPRSVLVRVKKVTHLAKDIVEVSFKRPAQLAFTAGQYMEWTIDHRHPDFRGNRRTLSIASAPSEDELLIAVRLSEPGSSYKRALAALKQGDVIRVSKVNGTFVLPDPTAPVLLIAAGIGITPFRSMIAEAGKQKQAADIKVLYVARDADHFAYKELLDKTEGVTTEYVSGRLAANALSDVLKAADLKRDIYISGPEGLVKDYKAALRKAGVPRGRLHSDHFTGY